MDKVPLGIANLDKELEGGLPKGTITIILGEPGSGKTTLIEAFLTYGSTVGDYSLCLLTNESPKNSLEDIKRLNLAMDEQNQINFILYDGFEKLDEDNGKFSAVVLGNFDDFPEMCHTIEVAVKKRAGKNIRIGLTDLSYFFLMYKKEDIFEFLRRLKHIVKENNATCIVELQKDMFDSSVITAVESLTDGTINMKRDDEGGRLQIFRLKGSPAASKWLKFEVLTEKGLSVAVEETIEEWKERLIEKSAPKKKQPVNKNRGFKGEPKTRAELLSRLKEDVKD